MRKGGSCTRGNFGGWEVGKLIGNTLWKQLVSSRSGLHSSPQRGSVLLTELKWCARGTPTVPDRSRARGTARWPLWAR